MGGRRSIALVLVLAVSAAVAGCGPGETPASSVDALGDDAVTVTSFDFAESEVLAELYAQSLEAGGIEVERAHQLGTRELVLPALRRGLVELVPEYAGSALQFVGHRERVAPADTEQTHRALRDVLAGTPVRALQPSPAADANAFVVTRDTARREGLQRLSDLAASAGHLTFGGPPECASRPLCLLGLQRVYDLRFQDVLTLDAGGPLTRQALRNGDVDVALLLSTDPALVGDEFVELVDDRRLQPAENVTPLVRAEVADRWGDRLVERLDGVSGRLTTEELRALNAAVTQGGLDPAEVAARWLRAEGLS